MKYMIDWIDDLCKRFYKHTHWVYRNTITDEKYDELVKQDKVHNEIHIVFLKEEYK
jgi:hypothetical protein